MQNSSNQDREGNTQLRQAIDVEIAALRAQICALYAKRNTLSPFYRLPPEILTRIFSYYQKLLVDSDITNEEGKKYRSWIILLQITQYLRELCLRSPELWTNIVVTNRLWISKCIERSRSNDLRVKLKIAEATQLLLFRQVMAHSHRITALEIDAKPAYWEEMLPLLKSSVTPVKALQLRLQQPEKVSKVVVPLPADLFLGTCSQLQQLVVDSFRLGLKVPLFTRTKLTSLSIISPTKSISITDIRHLLQRLPTLRALSLHDVLYGGRGPPISLPNLSSLDLKHRKTDINNDFLSSVIIPKTAYMRLRATGVYLGTLNPVEDILETVKMTTQQSSIVFREVKIRERINSIFIEYMKQPRSASGIPSPPSLSIEFYLGKPPQLDFIQGWITRFPSWLFSSLEVLQIACMCKLSSAGFWSFISRTIPNLRHLIVGRHRVTPHFVKFLDLQYPSKPSTAPAGPGIIGHDLEEELAIPYPALRRLCLHGLSDGDLKVLRRVFAIRKEKGMGLDELDIIDSANEERKRKVESKLVDTIKVVRWISDD